MDIKRYDIDYLYGGSVECDLGIYMYHSDHLQVVKELEQKKQLSIDELREQFETYLYQSCIPTIRSNFPKKNSGDYKFTEDQNKWLSYLHCAKANNIIKE